jgi:hypothetical protein
MLDGQTSISGRHFLKFYSRRGKMTEKSVQIVVSARLTLSKLHSRQYGEFLFEEPVVFSNTLLKQLS